MKKKHTSGNSIENLNKLRETLSVREMADVEKVA